MSEFSDLFDGSNLRKTIWSHFADKQIKSAEKQKNCLISLQIQQHENNDSLKPYLLTVKEKMIHWLIEKIGIRLTVNKTYLKDNFKSPLY